MECLFCEIVAGRAPASIAYEDEQLLAFLDLFPVTLGHLLIVPKVHCRNALDAPPGTVGRVAELGTRLARVVRSQLGCAGINFYIANEAAAGQEIDHLHLHLIPRYPEDGFGLRLPPGYGMRTSRACLDDLAMVLRCGAAEEIGH